MIEAALIEIYRLRIVQTYGKNYNEYQGLPEGTIVGFDELLCYEIHHGHDGEHEGGLTFKWLATKWNISLTLLGKLIADHCRRLE